MFSDYFLKGSQLTKMKQVNSRDSPGKEIVTDREFQYHISHRTPTFKGGPNNENQHLPPNLTSDDLWSWYVTFDLINTWINPYGIFDLISVVIGLQLFKGDPNNENLTKLEHTHPYTPHTPHPHTHPHPHTDSLSYTPPIVFQARGIKMKKVDI